ncbi:MAG TPA: contact-dependent growth inhibition system immunity protein [Candidatus Acidoferrum sp.]|jgi:hypothetical protein
MTTDKKKKPEANAVSDFPALRDFFSGYLHQDFSDEYGSVTGAAKAFRNDASDSEIKAVRSDWKLWREPLAKASTVQLASELRKLGASWQPQSQADLDELEKSLN